MQSFKLISLLAFLSALIFFIVGCSHENELTNNPADKLRFSIDTLTFDTVFSTMGSTTAWTKIYNPNEQKIKISNITLKSGGTKGYNINVDGSSDYPFTNVEIPAKDSIFLFVKLTPVEQSANGPILVEDAILFETNGNQQQIVLQAYSQNAVIWHGKTITSDTTLTSERPFLIYDSLVVAENVTLTIAKGVDLHFHNGSCMEVYGTVNVKGTQTAPVTFRGDRLDYVLKDFPYDNYPGQWDGIRLKESSFNNDWNYVRIKGAYYGIIADSSSTERSKLKITNSVIHNMVSNCLRSSYCNLSVANCQLTNSGSSSVCLIGGRADFTFCTIANYQHLILRDGGPALKLVNKDNETSQPFNFINTIVFGTQSNELGLDLSDGGTVSKDVYFKNCLLKTTQNALNPKYAVNCLYSEDPLFLKLGTADVKYIYDFRIDSISPVRNMADPLYSKTYSFDMNGIPRTNFDLPDIGAYEWHSDQ